MTQSRLEIPAVTVVDDAPEPVVGAVLLAMDVGEMPGGFAVRNELWGRCRGGSCLKRDEKHTSPALLPLRRDGSVTGSGAAAGQFLSIGHQTCTCSERLWIRT